MTQALADRLNAGGGPFAVIAHSQGSMIAYEVLRHLTRQDCDVKLFLTIGSPLGLQEVQDAFLQWDEAGLRVPQCVGRWVNVADRLDPVAMDSDLIGDFEPNEGGPENRELPAAGGSTRRIAPPSPLRHRLPAHARRPARHARGGR